MVVEVEKGLCKVTISVSMKPLKGVRPEEGLEGRILEAAKNYQ